MDDITSLMGTSTLSWLGRRLEGSASLSGIAPGERLEAVRLAALVLACSAPSSPASGPAAGGCIAPVSSCHGSSGWPSSSLS
eukprot:10694449-Alexandrium_andersonii.AAC.1